MGANKFVAELTGKNPQYINVPVVGGHAGVTILPLFSQAKAATEVDKEKIPDLDKKVQDAGTEVVNAKGGKGSATLSMAYAGARFGSAVLQGLAGQDADECAYVVSDAVEGMSYFSSRVTFGKSGVEKVHPIGDLNDHEKARLEVAKAQLKEEIQAGVDYAATQELNF